MKKIILFVLALNGLANFSFTESLAHANDSTLTKFFIEKCRPMTGEASEQPAFPGDPLSFAERVAIVTYTKSNFEKINRVLWRKEKLTPCDAAFVQIMDSALARLPNYRGTVYRGTSQNYMNLEAGKPYPQPLLAYTSTSLDRSVAVGFAKDRLEIISVRNGKDISRYSGAHVEGIDEKEILLPRGTLLKADKIWFEEIEKEFVQDGELRTVTQNVQIVEATE